MKNYLNTGYHGFPNMGHRTKDITAKELLELKEAKEHRQAVIVISIVFAAIITFGILAKEGSNFI